MTPADEMSAKNEPTEGQSVSAAAGFDNQFELPFVEDASLQPDSHSSEDVQSLLSRHLEQDSSERRAIYTRLQVIEGAIERRRSRGIVRYLIAMGIGVAATLGWQSYGETTKQIIATKAPELSWSPETKQMMTSWMQQLGWTKQPASPESTVVSSVPETAQPIPEPSPAPARKPTSTAPTSSRAPIPPHWPPYIGRFISSGEMTCCELTAVVSFIPCFYFLFLTVVAAVIIGLFNISRSERVHQDPSPGVERSVTATKRDPRLFMYVPKTKHGSPAKKAANSAGLPTKKADAKKSSTHHKSRAGVNGGY
jgi:hypothetical protein